MPHPISTAAFQKCLVELRKKGKAGRTAITEALAAQAEFANSGTISLKRTIHGESRLPDVEKYELANGAYAQYITPSRYLTTIQDACQEMEYKNGKLREIK